MFPLPERLNCASAKMIRAALCISLKPLRKRTRIEEEAEENVTWDEGK
jgi:hypothetical protein